MKKEIKILIILFIVAFFVRSIFVFDTPMRIWDETVYANLGYDLAHNPLDYSVANNGWSDFIPSGGDNFYAWPKMGFRAPLLPYLLMPLYLFNLNVLVVFFVAIVGALSVCLVYLLGKKLFNEKVAFYSAILFSITPLHVIYSAKILTGILFTFFTLLTFFSFWKGYEENNKKHKILFGIFLALALLSRYTALWITPIFLLYFLIRDKSLKFLGDKYLWYSILAFFFTLAPWFIYGVFEYKNPLGAFLHGFKASGYWGGIQSWFFFFEYWGSMFSVIGLVFIVAIIYILYKKEILKKEIYLLLIWFVFFLGMASCMPHKEDRFILAIVPVIALISGYFISKIKSHRKLIFSIIVIITIIQLGVHFIYTYNNSYTDVNKCFLESTSFLNSNVEKNSIIITDESSVVYYYTKLETRFYPNPWSLSRLEEWEKEQANKDIFILFSFENFVGTNEDSAKKMKFDLDNGAKKIFSCSRGEEFGVIYQI